MQTLASHNRADLSALAFSFTHISNEVFEGICRPSPYLSSLVMTYVDQPVDLNRASVGDDHDALVRALSTHCLEIEVLSLPKWCITYSALIALANLIYLRELDLSGCSNVTGGGVCSLLVSLCGKLEKLMLTGSCIDTTLLQSIGENCTKLTCLKLHIIDLGIDLPLIYASLIFMIIKCQLLKIVDFGNEVCIFADTIMMTLAHACRGLKTLVVTGCSDVGLSILLTSCQQLEQLTLFRMKASVEPTLPIIEKSCPNLRGLTIQSDFITDMQLCSIFKQCPNMLGFCLVCPLMSDATIMTLLEFCPKLKLIGILGPTQVTSAAPLTGFTHLEHIDILSGGV